MGYPLGNLFLTSTRAMVAAHVQMATASQSVHLKQYKLDGSLNGGNSGGPVISLRTGKVIGVADAKVGALSDNLTIFKNTNDEGIHTGGVGVFETMREIIRQLERQIYFGIGYAISSEYVANILGHTQLAQDR